MRVEAIHIAPVKSLGLQRVDRAHVGKGGLAGDRAFFLASERGRLVTQRECGRLVQVRAAYDIDGRRLRLDFPHGASVEAAVEEGEPCSTRFFGQRDVEGRVVPGPWADALSSFAGMPLRLVEAAPRQNAFDVLPVSILSAASIDALRANTGGAVAIDERRFRPNILVSGVEAHGEDAWIGRDVRVGTAVVRVLMRDERCAITTHSPDTGDRDFDTLGAIASYRTDQPKQVNFGVYGGVVTAGEAAVGDAVELVEGTT